MIENIRKYNILIIIGLVVIALALVVGLQSETMGGPTGRPYIKIGARKYNTTEYEQLGQHGFQITSGIAEQEFQSAMRLAKYNMELTQLYLSTGEFPAYYAMDSLAPNSLYMGGQQEKMEQFFINRILVRQAKKEFGIHPSDEQINQFISELPMFQGADSEFDAELYEGFIKNELGRRGMTERHFRELVSDIITTRHLRAVVSTGLQVHPDMAASTAALNQQQISGSVARMELSPFLEQIDPSDEELKAYWELIQDSFMTDELRRFSYILVSPKPVDEQAATDEEEEVSPVAEAAMTDEQRAKADKEKADKKAERDAKIAEQKRANRIEIATAVDDMMQALEESEGSGFEKTAAKYGFEIHTTELFSQTNPPKELEIELSGSNKRGPATKELFGMVVTPDPLSKISEALEVGDGQWLVAKLDETIKPRVKTFEEAKEEAREQYIREEALKAMEKAMDEASEKIASSLEEGASFEDASKAAGLSLIEPFEDLDSQTRPESDKLPANLFTLSRVIEPGSISEPLIRDENAYLIYVSKREIIEGTLDSKQLENEQRIMALNNGGAAFSDWLMQQAETAPVERLYTPQ